MEIGGQPIEITEEDRAKIRHRLSPDQFKALRFGLGAFTRILPHVQVSPWSMGYSANPTGAKWGNPQRRNIKLTIVIPGRGKKKAVSLASVLERLEVPFTGATKRTLDDQEKDICQKITETLNEMLKTILWSPSKNVVHALTLAFDQTVISRHIEAQHKFSPMGLLASLKKLSERSYEAKSIPLGILVETENDKVRPGPNLSLEECLEDKTFHVLTDGYDTAYRLNTDGCLIEVVDLELFSSKQKKRGGSHFYPEWSRTMAKSSTSTRIGFCLTRQGDILFFHQGTMRITYRGGRWQYWNHDHVLNILVDTTRTQRVKRSRRARLLGQIYRQALDLSFRRTGGLYLLLRNRKNLHKVVRVGEAIGDSQRGVYHKVLDTTLKGRSILGIPRRVMVDLASVDGAVVFNNSGLLRAYGSVLLNPEKGGGMVEGQGSRTKAAIGASKFGLATKVSSDGDIAFFNDGQKILTI